VADRINTSMKLVEAADADPMVDGSGPQSERVELAPRHDPVLSPRKLRYASIRRRLRTCVSFMLYVSSNFIHVPDFSGFAVLRDTQFVAV
jgi:hypothetical protein